MSRRWWLLAGLAMLACEPGVKPGGHLVILGDSIAQQAAEKLVYEGVERDWGYDFVNNSLVGMGACPQQQYNASGGSYSGIYDYLTRRVIALEAESHRDAWVIELGTNDTCGANYGTEAIAPLMAAIPADATVFWLTVSNRAGGALAVNAALHAADYPNLVVLEYGAHFDPHPEWFAGSGNVHLSQAGKSEFAKWLFGEVDVVFPDP